MSARTQPQTLYVCDRCGERIQEGSPVILASGRIVRSGRLAPDIAAAGDRHYHGGTGCWRRPEADR